MHRHGTSALNALHSHAMWPVVPDDLYLLHTHGTSALNALHSHEMWPVFPDKRYLLHKHGTSALTAHHSHAILPLVAAPVGCQAAWSSAALTHMLFGLLQIHPDPSRTIQINPDTTQNMKHGALGGPFGLPGSLVRLLARPALWGTILGPRAAWCVSWIPLVGRRLDGGRPACVALEAPRPMPPSRSHGPCRPRGRTLRICVLKMTRDAPIMPGQGDARRANKTRSRRRATRQ